MLGVTYDVRSVENSIYAVEDFLTMQLTTNQPAFGNVITRPLTYVRADQQIFSILGRVNYTFDNKYILTATVRRDGVSKFSKNNRYGVLNNLYGNASGGTNVPIALRNLANPDLTWETTEQVNFGIDFTTLNDIVSGNIDVYNKTTKDLLQNSDIPPSSGFTRILVNKGSITNNGVELALNFNLSLIHI